MVVTIKDLHKTYKGGNKALNGLSLEVREGEIFGLLGPNGSGKTTAINCLLSLLKYDSGEIKVFDTEISPDNYEIKKNIGVVFQNVAVFDELTVYENIDYFCGLYIKDKQLRKQYVAEAISFTSLEGYEKFRPKKLSGGLLRRLNIACGIAHKPKLIILDEPTVAVDPQSRNSILEKIVELKNQGSTIIYTSHYMEEVEQICDYITIIDKGNVIAHGTKEKLKSMIDLEETIGVEINDIKPEYLELFKDFLHAEIVDKKVIKIKCNNTDHNIVSVLKILQDNNISYGRIYSERPTLNDVFLELTGKELRD